MSDYIHGYNETEFERLQHQAEFLAPFIYEKLDFNQSQYILEPGCGVGAQTKILAEKNPKAQIIAFDREATAIEKANAWLANENDLKNQIQFFHADAEKLKLEFENYFDTCYICWVLEHVSNPVEFLESIKPLMKTSGKLMLTEVQNDSLQLSPNCPKTMIFWEALCTHQLKTGGDPNVGLKCTDFLKQAGYRAIEQIPYVNRVDFSKPNEFKAILEYWTNLMRSVSPFLSADLWEGVEEEMQELASNPNGSFSYTFIQTFGEK